MGGAIKVIIELIKYLPALIEAIRVLIQLFKEQGREKTVAQVKGVRDYYRAKEKLENA